MENVLTVFLNELFLLILNCLNKMCGLMGKQSTNNIVFYANDI